MKQPDISRIIELQKLLLTFSQIERVVDRRQGQKYIRESDTEHSYNLAMTAWFLAPHFPKLDAALVIKFALAHDIVEVHAGDTYAFGGPELIDTKAAREAAALKQLEAEWADFPDLLEAIHAYETKASEEAKFVYALDKIMPVMVIYINEGHTWQQEGLTLEQLHSVKKHQIALSKDIQPYYNQLLQLLVDAPHLIPKV